ncbi:MAG: sugar phosphate nucleotidyltransferase [Acidobacteriota bacterium]|nr:sugar phosphate nucleotidyltransferase [Acidobacteriota bacterium]
MPKANHYGLILAGGRGTRFWPRSRRKNAKQVLNVAGERTLIQGTLDRLASVIPPERIWILTNDFVRDEIVRQLPEVPESQIIAEPAQRNTAPAIALAAHILHSVDPKAVFGVFPADHVIGQPKRYLQFLRSGFKTAEKGSIGVLGIQPRWAETGYGYIEFPKGVTAGSLDALDVASFHEKPELKTARRFLKSGRHFWNAGMFFWKAETALAAMRQHQPRTAALIASLPPFAHPDFAARMAEVFPLCENVSVDVGVIEKADNVAGLACDEFGWNDVGSWDAVYELMPHDANANAARSELLCADSTGNYIDCGKKIVALLGVKDLIIVDTPDALLVADRSRAQQVGDIVKLLEKNKREDLL